MQICLRGARVLCAIVVLLTPTWSVAETATSPAASLLAEKVMRVTRDTRWAPVAAIKIPFKTFHTQGMVKIGEELYLSSVEIKQFPRKFSSPQNGLDRDAGAGFGHLFKFSLDGTLLADLRLGEGSIYHPGGIDFDGRSIWVPVSEYRPHSRAVIYKVDPLTMNATEAFRFGDHLGGVAYDRDTRQLHALNWGARQFYTWPSGFRASKRNAQQPVRSPNPNQYIDYQDCHYIPARRMLCSGLSDFAPQQGAIRFQLGGIDLIDLKSGLPIWQIPIELRSPTGRLMTQNPFFIEETASGLRAYFVPDDDNSTLFIFDAVV